VEGLVTSGEMAFVVSGAGLSSEFPAGLRVRSLRAHKRCKHRRCSWVASSKLASFNAGDFELRRPLGQQGWVEVTDWEYYGDEDAVREARLTQPKTTIQQSDPVVRLYEAKIGRGVLRNSRVLLKEFLGQGVPAGVNEAERYLQLYGSSLEDLNQAELPVATMLGGFTADDIFETQQFRQRWQASFPRVGEPPKKGDPWLVFLWEGTQTASSFPIYPQQRQFMDRFQKGQPLQRRQGYLRILMRKSLEALDFVHQRGVVRLCA